MSDPAIDHLCQDISETAAIITTLLVCEIQIESKQQQLKLSLFQETVDQHRV